MFLGSRYFSGGAVFGVALGLLLAPALASRGGLGFPARIFAQRVEVLRVMDGDTFEARARVWPGVEITTKVRLRDVDAPELRAGCAQERLQAEAARNALAALLDAGEVGLSDIGLDKYAGRVLALVSTRAEPDVGRALLAAGLARPYRGGHREGWCG